MSAILSNDKNELAPRAFNTPMILYRFDPIRMSLPMAYPALPLNNFVARSVIHGSQSIHCEFFTAHHLAINLLYLLSTKCQLLFTNLDMLYTDCYQIVNTIHLRQQMLQEILLSYHHK